MKKKKSSILLAACGIMICSLLLAFNFHQTSFATENSQTIPAYANKTTSYYSAKKANDTYRVGKLTFGDEVTILDDDNTADSWSRVMIDSKEYYMLSENLNTGIYNTAKVGTSVYVKENDVLKRLGYAFYGEQLEIQGYETVDGTKYAICKCPAVYEDTNLLATVAKDVVCYIKNSGLEETYTYKVVNAGTNLYQSAVSTANKTKLPFGSVVKEISHNSVWSKVEFNGTIGYVYCEKLGDYCLDVTQNSGKLRKSTFSSSQLEKTVYFGDSLQVIREYVASSGSRYLFCTISGKTGFISANYLGAMDVMYTDTLTNLYAEPSTTSKVVATVFVNQELVIENQGENWATAYYNGQKVFVQVTKLKNIMKVATGNTAATAKDLINAKYSSELQNAEVRLVAVNEALGYAKVLTAGGNTLWMKSSNLADDTRLMTVSAASCKYYTKPDSSSENIIAKLTLGDEVKEYGRQDTWSIVEVNGQMGFMYTTNLKDKKLYVAKVNTTVVDKNLVSLGYVPFGVECTVLEKVSFDTKDYYRCIVPTVYETSLGKAVVATNAEVYIRTTSLTDISTVKMVKKNSYLYVAPSSTADRMPLLTGAEVSVCCANGTWSKVKCDGEYYFVYNSKLENKVLSPSNKSSKIYTMLSSSSPVVKTVYWNTPIVIHGTIVASSGAEYAYCTYSKYAGYVILTSSSGTNNLACYDVRYVNCNSNVYADPNLDKVITEIHVDDEVLLLYQGESWSKIQVNGVIGFIQNEKLDMKALLANGSIYSTAYKLYKDTPSDTAEDRVVSLMAKSDKYQYAMVRTETGKTVWMSMNDLKAAAQSKTMYTVKHSTTLRTEATAESEEIDLPYMSELAYFGKATESESGSWLRVAYEGRDLYMWQPAGEEYLTETKSTFTYKTTNKIQSQVVALACEIVNDWKTKYVLGEEPALLDDDGYYCFDCSGYTSYVLNTVMRQYVPTYRLAAQSDIQSHTTDLFNMDTNQVFYAKDLKFEELVAGDVILFDMKDETGAFGHDGVVDHAGLYLGNNEFAHASKYFDESVQIMPLDDTFMESIVNMKRFLPTPEEIQPIVNLTMYTYKGTSVYAEASSDTEVLAKLVADKPVKVLYTSAYWVYGEYETGKFGFIYKDNLQEAEPETAHKMYSTSMSKKLYKEASTAAEYITVYIGTELLYKGQVGTTNYYKVEYQGSDYYLFSKEGVDGLLARSLDTVLYNQGEYMVNATTNFRLTPDSSSDANLIGQVKAGTLVNLYAVSDSWVCIVTPDGARGFVSPARITKLSELTKTSTTKYIQDTSKKIYDIASTSASYRTYYVGQKITYYSRLGTTSYYLVSVDGMRGFIFTEGNIDDVIAGAYTPCDKVVLITTKIRSTPNTATDDNVIDVLTKGTTVNVIYQGDTWAYIYDPVSKQYGYALVSKF